MLDHGTERHEPDGCATSANREAGLRRRPEIKLRQLRYFLAAAEHLHFSKAADAQFVTQSTLSHQIAELETQVGQPLFDRTARAIRLTQAGDVFRVHAKRIVNEVDVGCSALVDLNTLMSGSVRIGATQSFVHCYLGAALGSFMTQNPAMRLQVEELTAPQIERQLCAGQLDLGIAFAPTSTSDIKSEPLFEEDMVLVVGADHSLAGSTSVRMAALECEPLALLSNDHISRRQIDSCFRAAGISPRVKFEANSLTLMLDLVRSSNVAAILPSRMVDGKSGLRALALTDPTPTRTVALLRSHRHHESEAARSMAALLRKRFTPEAVPDSAVKRNQSVAMC